MTEAPASRDGPVKRSVVIAGHSTSVTLEPAFWQALARIAKARRTTLPRLMGEIDRARVERGSAASLSSAIRVFVLEAVQGG